MVHVTCGCISFIIGFELYIADATCELCNGACFGSQLIPVCCHVVLSAEKYSQGWWCLRAVKIYLWSMFFKHFCPFFMWYIVIVKVKWFMHSG